MCDRGITKNPGSDADGDLGGAGLQMAAHYYSRRIDEHLLRKSLALATEPDLEMLQHPWGGFCAPGPNGCAGWRCLLALPGSCGDGTAKGSGQVTWLPELSKGMGLSARVHC